MDSLTVYDSRKNDQDQRTDHATCDASDVDPYPTRKYRNAHRAMWVIAPRNFMNYTLCRFLATGERGKFNRDPNLEKHAYSLKKTNPEAIEQMIEDYKRSAKAFEESEEQFKKDVEAWKKRYQERTGKEDDVADDASDDDPYPRNRYPNRYIAMREIAPKSWVNYSLCRFVATGDCGNALGKTKNTREVLEEKKKELEKNNPEAIKQMIEDYQKSTEAYQESLEQFQKDVAAWKERNPDSAAARMEKRSRFCGEPPKSAGFDDISNTVYCVDPTSNTVHVLRKVDSGQ